MEKGKAVEWYVIVPRFIDFQLGWLEREQARNIREVEVQVYMAKCPICRRRIYGLSESEVRKRLIEHLNNNCK
jgi:hypothetical protein